MAQFSIVRITYQADYRGSGLPNAMLQLSDGSAVPFSFENKRYFLEQGLVNIQAPPEPLPLQQVETPDGEKQMVPFLLPDDLAADALMVFVDAVNGALAPLQDGQILLQRK